MRRAAPCHAAVNSRNVAGMMIVSLSILAMALAFAGVIIGFRQPPASTFGAAILPAVWLPYALVLWWSYRRQAARAAALAGGTALVAFLSLALFAGVLTLLLGLAMGNQDQVNFVLLLDAFVLLQLPLAVAGWRAWRRVPAAERPGGCWTVGLGLPLLVAAGVAAAFVGTQARQESRTEAIYRNEQSARDAMATAAACLKRHAERQSGYPSRMEALVADGCLDAALAAGRLPAHRLRYSPGVPDADGLIRLYGLCAEVIAEDYMERAWRTYVADETGNMQQAEPRQGMTRGPACGEAWEDRLIERVRYCVVDHAARFPGKGYPATLGAVAVHPGTGCLSPSPYADLNVERDGAAVRMKERRVAYRAGTADAQGRVAGFEIHGEQVIGGRWTVQVMVDERGDWHFAEGRQATRADPGSDKLATRLAADEAERQAVRAAEMRQCEAGNARLCRALGEASYGARRDSEAFAAWRQGCAHGDGVSCLLSRREEGFQIFTIALDFGRECAAKAAGACDKLEKLGRDHLACQGGEQPGCSALAVRLGQRGQTYEANRIWEKGCADGHRESCYLLRARDFEFKGALQLKDLCDSGRRDACAEFERRMVAFLSAGPG